MKKLVIFAALLAMVFGPLSVRAQTAALKIGYIDIQKVMLESEKGKEARKLLTDEFEKRKKVLSQKQDELQKLKDAIEKQSAMITPEARAEKEKQYQSKLREYQRQANDYQGEMQQKEQELLQRVVKDLEEFMKQFGDQEKYTLIVDKVQGGVVYGAPAFDITDKIVTQFNAFEKKKTAAPSPAKK
jgi:outer membrane protein